jgi:hypothetical protein
MLKVFAIVISIQAVSTATYVLDFETEDDFVTPLSNGQAIDTEFGNFVNISSRIIGYDGHLGPAIFDSSPGGLNDYPGAYDNDLLVGLGNVLILQNDDHPAQSIPGFFDIPDDEASYSDRGAFVFDFLQPVQIESIDLIDIDNKAKVEITLTDNQSKQRVYSIGQNWTTDVSVSGDGWETLDLTTLSPQAADGTGGPAIVTFNDALFDGTSIVNMDVAFIGCSPSGAIDNIAFIPEPMTVAFIGLGAVLLRKRKKDF